MALTSITGGLLMCLAICVSVTNGVFVNSPCPHLPSKLDFDASRYTGMWYDYERFETPYEQGDPCTGVGYELNPDGSMSLDFIHHKENNGIFRVPDKSKPGEFEFHFAAHVPPFHMHVVDTDYETYTVEFSCTNVGDSQSQQLMWILTRERGLAPANLQDLHTNIQNAGVDVHHFHHVRQTNCH